MAQKCNEKCGTDTQMDRQTDGQTGCSHYDIDVHFNAKKKIYVLIMHNFLLLRTQLLCHDKYILNLIELN